MHIWVDADACPAVIKDILYRAAERTKIPATLVANTGLPSLSTSVGVSVIRGRLPGSMTFGLSGQTLKLFSRLPR